MRFFLGLIVGALCGGGGVYAALEKPWEGTAAEVLPDAGPEAAGDTRPKKKRRRGKRGQRGQQVEIAMDGAPPVLSAADRRLHWKGDPVKPPAKQVDFAGDNQGRALTAGEINQVLGAQSQGVLSCITTARGNAQLEATITIKMLVDGEGRVTRTRIRAPAYLFAHGFYGCARKAARALRFPGTGQATVVEAPYDLY